MECGEERGDGVELGEGKGDGVGRGVIGVESGEVEDDSITM